MNEIDNAMILVGKNNTGKTSILDAILSVSGQYTISSNDFYDLNRNIEVEITMEITEEDLLLLHQQGVISKYKRLEVWKKDFCSRLPSYQNGRLTFTYIVNKNGTKRYFDGFKKNNNYIPLIVPKIHFIDHERNPEEIQEDILKEINKSRNWIERILKNKNIGLNDVFYAFYKGSKVFIIKRSDL